MNLSYGAKLDRIKAGLQVVRLAEQKLATEAVELLKAGDVVHWERAGHRQAGSIVRVAFKGGRLLVSNRKTGKRVWISLTDLVEGAHS